MAINVTPTSDGPGGTAQTLRSPGASPRTLFPHHCPAGNEAAAGGLSAGLGSRLLPGGWGCTPHAAGSCSASEGEAAPGRPLRSRLPPSLGGPLPPGSRWPMAGPICSRGRLPLPGTAAADGSGAEASEAALCQGAPDWLTGLRNGYLGPTEYKLLSCWHENFLLSFFQRTLSKY
ncbi:ejaculatory bulb-specific protein 1-like [Agelaius tricolor]|uniref:ejaculatory bulb-specific protein 1-like n=1 Tax=Agelaius tricolor TaxID=9191 RepID=UPI0039F23135